MRSMFPLTGPACQPEAASEALVAPGQSITKDLYTPREVAVLELKFPPNLKTA
jgi:hypothetical protein